MSRELSIHKLVEVFLGFHRDDLVLGNHGAFVFEKAIIDNVLECCRKILAHEDGHILTNMLGHTLYSACAVGDDMLRLDGKQGNVLYREDKAV